MPKPKMMRVTGTVGATAEDEKRLRKGGFVPVLRWMRPLARSGKALKTREALALLAREEREERLLGRTRTKRVKRG